MTSRSPREGDAAHAGRGGLRQRTGFTSAAPAWSRASSPSDPETFHTLRSVPARLSEKMAPRISPVIRPGRSQPDDTDHSPVANEDVSQDVVSVKLIGPDLPTPRLAASRTGNRWACRGFGIGDLPTPRLVKMTASSTGVSYVGRHQTSASTHGSIGHISTLRADRDTLHRRRQP